MKLIDNIYCNSDKLIIDKDIELVYKGKLINFQNAVDEKNVYICYGYGKNFECFSCMKMKKFSLGYKVNIKLKKYDKLSFYIYDSNLNWDTNNGKLYNLEIEEIQQKEFLPLKMEKHTLKKIKEIIELGYKKIAQVFENRLLDSTFE